MWHSTFCFILLNFLFLTNISATVYNSKTDGNWNAASTWWENAVPGEMDTVSIDGHIITVNDKRSVKRLFITNSTAVATSSLVIMGSDTLTVSDNMIVVAENVGEHVIVDVQGSARLLVGGDLKFYRASDNTQTKVLQLLLSENSGVYVAGDFLFDYKNAGGETQLEIQMLKNAILDVTGKSTFITRAGKKLDISLANKSQMILKDSLKLLLLGGDLTAITANDTAHLQLFGSAYMLNANGADQVMLKTGDNGGKMTITGSLTMKTTAANMDAMLVVDGEEAEIYLNGDLILEGFAQQDVYIDLNHEGKLFLGGDVIRNTPFGYLTMNYGAQVIFNGDDMQTIPKTKVLSSGTDSLDFQDVVFQNSSSAGVILSGDLRIKDTLFLNNGIVHSHDTALIILEDDAMISGGSEDSYVNGPIMKMGKSNGDPFVFHIGDSDTYAPLELGALTDGNDAYVASFYGDPPPFGEQLHLSIDHIAGGQYWSLTPIGTSPDLPVTLHWTDAQAQGINNLGSLIVVGLDGSNIWQNAGNAGTTGGTGSGVSGSVSASVPGDPPPFGEQFFTLGSTGPLNSLPVELTKFGAVQQKEEVYLEWETASEINVSHFIVERMNDENLFTELHMVSSRGDAHRPQKYTSRDWVPLEGMNYYRLKIVDEDGAFEYSHIEVVKFRTSPEINVFPNPVANILQVERSDSQEEDIIFEVFDRSGKLLYIDQTSFSGGRLKITTDAINVHTAGTYFLRITDSSGSQVLKFIKTN